MTFRTASVIGTTLVAACGMAQGQLWLNGALSYSADGTTGANAGGAFEYDSFLNTPNSALTINGSRGVPVALSLGTNVFTLQNGGGPASTGLGMYFTTDSTLITGPFGAAPDLVAFTNAIGFAMADANALVATYGQFSGDTPYSGATTFTGGGFTVSVKNFIFTGASGELILDVVAVPAPSAGMALGLMGVFAGRRRR